MSNESFEKCQRILANARYDAILAFDLSDCINDYDFLFDNQPPAYERTKEFKRFERVAKHYGKMSSIKAFGNIELSEQITEGLTNQLSGFLSSCELKLSSGRDVQIASREEHSDAFVEQLNNDFREYQNTEKQSVPKNVRCGRV